VHHTPIFVQERYATVIVYAYVRFCGHPVPNFRASNESPSVMVKIDFGNSVTN